MTQEASSYTREFNAARKAQGFPTAESLAAFFASLDHNKTCTACKPSSVWLEGSASWQPTLALCPIGQALDKHATSLLH